ncbi:MAG: hypothetical protein IBJ10_04860 [Phycisphaerales bacterium]|nr:hypothetical protein [Phycisphaerales bacterium]
MDRIRIGATGLAMSLSFTGAALGQAAFKAAFVANNGNLEGSVTTYRVNDDGTLTWIAKHITGERPNTQVFHPGTNANAISLSPNGRYVLTAHSTSSQTVEQVTFLRVHADGTLTPALIASVPDSPLDVQWIDNEYFAVTKTSTSTTNQVLVYRFDATAPAIFFVDAENTGTFSSSLALHPNRTLLFTQDSNSSRVSSFSVAPNGHLTLVSEMGPGIFPLGLGVSADGKRIYFGGGISSGGNKVGALSISPTGVLDFVPGAPFISPGASPKQVVTSADSKIAIAAHGTDSTLRSFFIDSDTGALTSTGFMYDIGFQGSLGDVAVLGDWLLAPDRDTISDGVRGLRSLTIGVDGSLTPNGDIVDSQGITPNAVAPWANCPADLDGDGRVDFVDLNRLLGQYNQSAAPGVLFGDLNFDGVVDFGDLNILLGVYNLDC